MAKLDGTVEREPWWPLPDEAVLERLAEIQLRLLDIELQLAKIHALVLASVAVDHGIELGPEQRATIEKVFALEEE